LIIDDISFATNFDIWKINEHLILLKDTIAPFGGTNIVFAGDLRQLEPISGKPIYFDAPNNPRTFQHVLNSMDNIDTSKIQNGVEILSQLRNVTPTASDIEAINCNVHDKDDNLPSDIKYVMYTNKDRDIIIMF
jgi:hypothetical protein